MRRDGRRMSEVGISVVETADEAVYALSLSLSFSASL